MVPMWQYAENLSLVRAYLRRFKGCTDSVVECGAWRGGMSAGLIDVTYDSMECWFYDSFEGLPAVSSQDGDRARLWKKDVTHPRYFNNCLSTRLECEETILESRTPNRAKLVGGDIRETATVQSPKSIAILRLDVDWYKTTHFCLRHFWPLLKRGGIVIIDDYYHWEGCRKAVHKFLATEALSIPLRVYGRTRIVYLIKDDNPNAY